MQQEQVTKKYAHSPASGVLQDVAVCDLSGASRFAVSPCLLAGVGVTRTSYTGIDNQHQTSELLGVVESK